MPIFDRLPANNAAPAARTAAPSGGSGMLERGAAALAGLKDKLGQVGAASLQEADQRLRAAEAHAENVWQDALRALQGPSTGFAMAVGAEL